MHGLNREPLGAETFFKKPAQLNIVVDDKNALHALENGTSELDPSSFSDSRNILYTTLLCFTNLYRK
jgi:hypothetical protein